MNSLLVILVKLMKILLMKSILLRRYGKCVKSASGLLEDYWFGHRIQHGSSDQVNVTITEGYEIKAKKNIKIGKELFMDYNRSIVCRKCESESDFYDLCFKKSKKCYFCGNMCLKLKKCSNCEA